MPRIADSELKRLKEEISVQRLVEASGIELSRAGKDFAGRCPFHEDDTASLLVTPAKNLWHCFGCGIGGGPIDWVMKKNGVSFRHAVELLREGMPALAADSTSTAPHRGWVRALPIPVALQADDQALMHQVVDYYHASLKTSPEALAYLQSRGFTGEAAQWMIDTFKLGYGNRTLGLRLPTKSRKDGAEIRTRLEALGIYRESGHEHMNGSLVVPLYALPESHHHDADQPLPVVNLYGRKIRHDLRAGTPLHLYLANRDNESSRRGVFNPRALLAGDGVTVNEELIVCEAIIDALTFWCAGYRNVTTAYGVEGVTAELMQAIARMATCGLKRVLIAFDRDEAGERGAAKFADKLIALGLNCYRIEFPKGMDANDYAMKVQPAHKALGLLIRKAVWLGKGSAPARQNVPPTVQVVESQPSQNGVYSGITALAPSTNPAPTLAAKDRSEIATLASQNLPAAAVPSAPVDTAATVSEREVVLSFGEGKDTRRWRVRGLPKNLAVGVLKVNVMVNVDDGNSSLGAGFHVDTFDLYAARARAVFVQQAMIETGLPEAQLKSDLGRVLLKLEALQDAAIADALDPSKSSTVPLIPAMTDAEHESAMNLLQSPDLLARIEADFEACGVVGEGTNKRVAYLAAVSRFAGATARRGDSIIECSREEFADGSGARLCATGGEEPVQRNDRAELVLHGADQLEAPHPGHCRGRGGEPSQLRDEAASERRRAHHRQHRHRCGHGQPHHAGIPRRGADDVDDDHDGHRSGRRVVEPLPGADRR